MRGVAEVVEVEERRASLPSHDRDGVICREFLGRYAKGEIEEGRIVPSCPARASAAFASARRRWTSLGATAFVPPLRCAFHAPIGLALFRSRRTANGLSATLEAAILGRESDIGADAWWPKASARAQFTAMKPRK